MKKIVTMLIVFFINLTPCMYAENFDEVEVKNEGSRVVVKLTYNKEIRTLYIIKGSIIRIRFEIL